MMCFVPPIHFFFPSPFFSLSPEQFKKKNHFLRLKCKMLAVVVVGGGGGGCED